MKKQKTQLLVMVLVLVVLAAAFLGLRFYNQKQANEGEEPAGEPILSLDSGLVSLSYDYEGETYEYDKVDGVWYYTPNHEWNLTQYRLESIERRLEQLTANSTIENVTDLSQYGLAEDYRVVTFETETGSYTLWLGSKNDITGDYYICEASGTTVYAVDSSFVTSFNLNVETIVEEEEESTEESTEEAE